MGYELWKTNANVPKLSETFLKCLCLKPICVYAREGQLAFILASIVKRCV